MNNKVMLIFFNIFGLVVVVIFIQYWIFYTTPKDISSLSNEEIEEIEVFNKEQSIKLRQSDWEYVLKEIGNLKSTNVVCKTNKCKVLIFINIKTRDSISYQLRFKTSPYLKGDVIVSIRRPLFGSSLHYGRFIGTSLYQTLLNNEGVKWEIGSD